MYLVSRQILLFPKDKYVVFNPERNPKMSNQTEATEAMNYRFDRHSSLSSIDLK